MMKNLPPILRKRKTTGSRKYVLRVSKEGVMPEIPHNWPGPKIRRKMGTKDELASMDGLPGTQGKDPEKAQRRLAKPRRRMKAAGERPGSGPGENESKGTNSHDQVKIDLVAPMEVDPKEKTKTTETSRWTEWRQNDGCDRSKKVETPKNGRTLNYSKKCPKRSSQKLRGGGPKSSQGKDGWSDSSQRKIDEYFGAIKEESHGNS